VISRCAIVVPCYNEAQRLPAEQFREFLSGPGDVSLVFVNDGSRDATIERLGELQAVDPGRVAVVDRKVNSGKGEAVRAGLLHAIGHSGAPVVGFWDADLATPLDAIADLLGILDSRPDIDMVFGARVKLLGRRVERRAARHYLGRIFATVVSNLLRMPIYDTQCGAKLFRVTPLLRGALGQPFSSRWVFDVELLARFIRSSGGNAEAVRDRIYEFPLHAWNDVAGSKVRPKDFLRAFADVAMIWRKYLA
jgi:glycosyltransferase involved in cell wall biosynthesis